MNDISLIETRYATSKDRLVEARKRLGRPLTYAEKVLCSHLDAPSAQEWAPGSSQLALRPDRVAMQDATAQMALLQFMQSGQARVAVPSTVHCDHLIRAQSGAAQDIERAKTENKEVYDFLRSASAKYGIGFWEPGAGIIHQVVLERYAFPGGLLIGTDSHTPNGGGLGMLAIGVGGADAGEVMAGLPWEVLHPKLIGVKLIGQLSGWTSPKDVILYLCGLLTTKGGTNKIIEYFGPGAATISCTGKATIANMGAELGATGTVFPFDARMAEYLRAMGRADVAALAEAHAADLAADPEVAAQPDRYYDEVIEIDLSALMPHVVGPHSPDVAHQVTQLADFVTAQGHPAALTSALIGSCTNSSYEDLSRAADVARQGIAAGLKAKVPFFVTPGSTQVYDTVKRDGLLDVFEQMGGIVLANACGPCIGQWKRSDIPDGQKNSIISSFNRNFPGRNDGNALTCSFLASPEVVTAYAFTGRLDSDPIAALGLKPPVGDTLPTNGFVASDAGFQAPGEGTDVEVLISPTSERLQVLRPFDAWDGKDMTDLPILLKTKGKTTTDHISPAGKWLAYRGHLDKISDNMFSGAINAFSDKPGTGLDVRTGEREVPISQIARRYKAAGLGSLVIGDENYGEGSSREHAAMSPRYLGVRAVLARSFARIHETNLKKQGILPLTFADAGDYGLFGETDKVSVIGLSELAPGRAIEVLVHKPDGTTATIKTKHSLTAPQIAWFKAGSALNALKP